MRGAVELNWIGALKNELKKSPVISNSVFTFILMGLEKMVELDFECPCKPNSNRPFSLAFFIIPAFLAFLLMLISLRCDCCGICESCGSCKSSESSECCDCCGSFKRFCFSVVPAVTWLILVFLDGQYFVCARTDWEGKFVSMGTENLKKWCEPVKENKINSTTQELMLKSQEFYFTSQVWGMALLGCICAGLVVYQCMTSCTKDNDSKF